MNKCGCFVNECGCFVEKCACNVDPPHLHISQFDQVLSPPWSVILKKCDCGCNVDPSDFHTDN